MRNMLSYAALAVLLVWLAICSYAWAQKVDAYVESGSKRVMVR